jgi:hypothetical protein
MMFTCADCGAEQPALEPEVRPMVAPEDLAKLRAKWLKASEAHTPSKGDEIGAGVVKASLAYFGTFQSGVYRVPTGMRSLKSPSGFRLVCVACAPLEKEL